MTLPPLSLQKPSLTRWFLPVTGWLCGYKRSWLTGDILAGLTIWALLVPEGLAYAGIAGVPAKTIPGLLIYRFDAPLVFPNAERFITEIRTLLKALEPPVKTVVIDFEVVSDMDTTASDQFVDLLTMLEQSGASVTLARVHEPVREFMAKDGLVDKIGEENFYPRVLDAVQAFKTEGSTGGE
jgi:MFS superfamily sulfate permease-like transporter